MNLPTLVVPNPIDQIQDKVVEEWIDDLQRYLQDFNIKLKNVGVVPMIVTKDPQDATPANRPSATLGEIVFYNGKWYGCTNALTPTFEEFTSV